MTEVDGSGSQSEFVDIVSEVGQVPLWNPAIGDHTSRLLERIVSTGQVDNREEADRVVMEALRVLSKSLPPTSDDGRSTGLVVGRVQSGKTLSMNAVTTLARDNGFRIVIFLAGVTTNLVDQNYNRFEDVLRNLRDPWSWVIIKNPTPQTDYNRVEQLLRGWRATDQSTSPVRTLFISVMKHHGHLDNLTQLLSGFDLQGVPVMVFDDEADQAGLNTRPLSAAPSSTHRNIQALRACLPHHTYLQYTATPQAPLLIARIDELSADWVELLTPGQRYTGIDVFFEDRQDLVSTIPDNETFTNEDDLPISPPRSLIEALQIFFVGVAAGTHQGPRPDQRRSMLVHPSHKTAIHRRYQRWAETLRSTWRDTLMGSTDDPDHGNLLAEFETAHRTLGTTATDIPSFDELQALLPQVLMDTEITLVNSRTGSEVNWDQAYSHILIGGEKLGRGYTVKGLTVTYMPRSAGTWTADTIQQRARFFGYHEEYLEYCRLFLNQDIGDVYQAYVLHETQMRRQLEAHRDLPLGEWNRVFYLDRRLRPTRRNVLSTPYLRPNLSGNWYAPTAPHDSVGHGENHTLLVSHLEQSLPFAPDDTYPQHKVLRNMSLRSAFEELLVNLSYSFETDAIGLCAVNCGVSVMLEENSDELCDVWLMHSDVARFRTLNTNGRIPQVFQGASSAGRHRYPGDRAMHDPTRVTIQIHRFQIRNPDDAVISASAPAIAIRLPRELPLIIQGSDSG